MIIDIMQVSIDLLYVISETPINRDEESLYFKEILYFVRNDSAGLHGI